jgi:hypothetical protein
VKKTLQVFDSFEAADRADAARDASLTPEERIQIVLELHAQRHPDAASQRFARVCRVIELEQS